LSVRTPAFRRRIAVITASCLAFAATSASPGAAQEDPSAEGDATEHALVEINVSASDGDPADIAGALGDISANVEAQLDQLELAQAAVHGAHETLADRQSAVDETEGRIAAVVDDSDAVVTRSFVNPPSEAAIEVFTEPSPSDATIKRALLDIQAESDATTLATYERERRQLVEDKEAQEQARDDAEVAQAEAETALVDLRAAVSQQTQFVLEVQERLADEGADPGGLADDPDVAAGINELAGKLAEVQEAHAFERAQEAIREAQQRLVQQGRIICPVQGEVGFIDSWGFARSGGRSHQGVDMMAPRGTPTVAPTNGDLVHKSNNLGGTTWYVYGDNGNYYYGAHLEGYEGGEGRVQAGDVIGYVGDSGDARGGATHLHFEIHPDGGSAVNPFPETDRACPGHGAA
jgi:murein DD-endopeptidase MepM/ murein hydrolase activator NlpD